jgi:flavodoxin/NAD-dependent dihydropyrimidine dehydrogenase PreA subunit
MERGMNMLLMYFSQTGSTRRVAEAMAGELAAKGHTVRTLPMEKALPEDISGCDVLGFGTPCFESQAPSPVKNFLSALPYLKGKPAFVFATSGGSPGRVLYDLSRILSLRGASVVTGFMGRGEVHHPAPCLKGRMPGRPDGKDLARARAFAASLHDHLQAGRTDPMPGGRKDVLSPRLGFYELVSLIAQPLLLRILLPRPKTDGSACNGCNLCVKECPAGSISLNPYPVPDSSCIRCYRCQNICPQKAISSSWAFGNIVIFSLYNTLLARLFGDLEPGEHIY